MKKTPSLLLTLAILLAGCVPRQGDPGVPADPAHNSRNALDWAGVYEGVLPCADCPGISTRLTLQADGHYALRTQYLDRQPAPQTVQGRFSWNAAGNTIVLDAAGRGQQFRVGEGRLLQLGLDGSVPSWSDPTRVLKQLPAK
jgi:uncharacterized lipoprotein NlpE involved in copper resistance